MSIATSSVHVFPNSLNSSFGSNSTLSEDDFNFANPPKLSPADSGRGGGAFGGLPLIRESSKASSVGAQKSGSNGVPHGPMAILTPGSNSHPFDERRVVVSKTEGTAIKIGRAVARVQPSLNNAIFDCKVLSRNHALLWFEDGTFYIKDTRSSNGTFVNNFRLSSSGEESPPKALYSGDVLQLGVEIVDNSKNVASGCITCVIKLIDESGNEVVAHPTAPVGNRNQQPPSDERVPSNHTLIRNDKLYLIYQYVKEGAFREKKLEDKIRKAEELLSSAEMGAQNGWQALINEERLLSRIEILETQLAIQATKGNTVSSIAEVREEITNAFEDRTKAELAAKDSLRKAEEQIYESSMKVHDMENVLMNLEEENQFLKRSCSALEVEIAVQRTENEQLRNQVVVLEKAQEAAKAEASTSHRPLFQVQRVNDENDPSESNKKKSPSPEDVSDATQLCSLAAAVLKPSVFYSEAEVQTDALHAAAESTSTACCQTCALHSNQPTTSTALPLTPRDQDQEAEYLLYSVLPLTLILAWLLYPLTRAYGYASSWVGTDSPPTKAHPEAKAEKAD